MKTKINFDRDGKRTSITLNQALIDTWMQAQWAAKPWSAEADLWADLRKAIAETPQKDGQTFVESVEVFLLQDVRDGISGLLAKLSRQ